MDDWFTAPRRASSVRNGQPGARIPCRFAGYDWGARTANIVALWSERCKAMVPVSGFQIGSQEAGKMSLPPNAVLE
jgi:hypothetical protein